MLSIFSSILIHFTLKDCLSFWEDARLACVHLSQDWSRLRGFQVWRWEAAWARGRPRKSNIFEKHVISWRNNAQDVKDGFGFWRFYWFTVHVVLHLEHSKIAKWCKWASSLFFAFALCHKRPASRTFAAAMSRQWSTTVTTRRRQAQLASSCSCGKNSMKRKTMDFFLRDFGHGIKLIGQRSHGQLQRCPYLPNGLELSVERLRTSKAGAGLPCEFSQCWPRRWMCCHLSAWLFTYWNVQMHEFQARCDVSTVLRSVLVNCWTVWPVLRLQVCPASGLFASRRYCPGYLTIDVLDVCVWGLEGPETSQTKCWQESTECVARWLQEKEVLYSYVVLAGLSPKQFHIVSQNANNRVVFVSFCDVFSLRYWLVLGLQHLLMVWLDPIFAARSSCKCANSSGTWRKCGAWAGRAKGKNCWNYMKLPNEVCWFAQSKLNLLLIIIALLR